MTNDLWLNWAPPLAHVSYVVDPEKLEALSGSDWAYFLSPLSDPFYVTLIVVTLVVVVTLYAACELLRPLRTFCREIHNRLLIHLEYVPLALRLSLGVALIVAGVGDVIFVPNVPAGGIGGLEVGIGFCLVSGFMVRASGVAALSVFVYGMTQSHVLLGTLESAAAALLVIAHGPHRPSTDNVLDMDPLGKSLKPMWDKISDLTPVILRLSLGTTLIWLAITEKFFNPRVCEAVVIDYDLMSVIPVSTAMWVFSVSAIELAVGLILVLGLYTRSFALIALVVLSLSFFYFKEEVAGHVTFFGALIVIIVTGAGRWSIDSLIARVTRNVTGTAQPYEI